MPVSGHGFEFRGSEDAEDITKLNFESLVLDEGEIVPVRLFGNHFYKQDIVYPSSVISEPRDNDILALPKSVYRQSRSFELGTFASSILSVAMQHQARKIER
jgi:hypothetical protein